VDGVGVRGGADLVGPVGGALRQFGEAHEGGVLVLAGAVHEPGVLGGQLLGGVRGCRGLPESEQSCVLLSSGSGTHWILLVGKLVGRVG
jgi:hypothetical protein